MIKNIRNKIVTRVNNKFFYGWTILAVAGFGIFASGPGQSHTFSVFIGPISRDLGVGAFLLLVLAANMFVFLVKCSVCRVVAPGVARVIRGNYEF